MDVQKLIDIARECGQNDLAERLLDLGSEMEMDNANLMLPLVGEFSSGKTTLINAVTNSKGLETASKPTTAVIYEIFFGQKESGAVIIDKEGNQKEIDDISSLKNEELQHNAEVVQIFDTCDKIPSSTILIDTPGLGSMEKSHRDALNDFLPKADAILFTLDVSRGGLTRKITDFINVEQAIIKKPLYLIITMSDKMMDNEVQQVIDNIKKNDTFGFKKIISVSADKNQLDAFYEMIKEIDKDKANIHRTVNEQRIKNIAKSLSQRIDELLAATKDDNSLNQSVSEAKRSLERLKRNIETLIDDTKNDIDDVRQSVVDEFCESVDRNLIQFANLTNVDDLNDQFNNVVHSISGQSFEKFKRLAQIKLNEKARSRVGTDNEVNLQQLSELDLESIGNLVVDGNLDLSSIGHKYDKGISTAINVIGTGLTIAGLALAPLTGGISGGAVIGGNVGVRAIAAGTLKATKAAKAAEMAATAKRMKALQVFQTIKGTTETLVSSAQEGQKRYQEKNKGFIEKIVAGFAELLAPGQRKIAIRNFVETELKPSFDSQLEIITDNLFVLIEKGLQDAAQEQITLKQESLEKLRKQRDEHNEQYRQTLSKYRQYKIVLTNYV